MLTVFLCLAGRDVRGVLELSSVAVCSLLVVGSAVCSLSVVEALFSVVSWGVVGSAAVVASSDWSSGS